MQGRLMLPMLETLEIPHVVIGPETKDWEKLVKEAVSLTGLGQRVKPQGPAAIVCQAGLFQSPPAPAKTKECQTSFQLQPDLSREAAVETILATLACHDIVVVTTGMASREVFESRERRRESHASDFLTVGSMGHANQIALAIARARQNRSVYCIDGDGAVIMHMGSLAICGTSACSNFHHIVLNNGAHDSVGGQPTVALRVDLCAVAGALGYKLTKSVSSRDELKDALAKMVVHQGPSFLEVRVGKGGRADLGRPSRSMGELRDEFRQFVAAPE
jgi:phosphonopyruvate decarboxylase